MATWTNLVDSLFDSGQAAKGSIFRQLRDNMTALAEGASGAPKIQGEALSSGIISNDKIYNFYAGDIEIFYSSDTAGNYSESYVKCREVRIPRNGTLTIKFSMKTSEDSYHSYGRIYVNGVAVGTERDTTSTSYTTYTENITVNRGDLIQLYLKSTSGTRRALSGMMGVYVGDTLETSTINSYYS